MHPRTVTIFGGGQFQENDRPYLIAMQIGQLIAECGWILCNGGYGGVMEASARGAKNAGGKTIGITTRQFNGRCNAWIEEERVTETWRERLFSLIDTADAYIVLDGATGTFAELFVVWEMTNKDLIQKPIAVVGDVLNKWLQNLQKEPVVIFNPYLKTVYTAKEAVAWVASASSNDMPQRF